MTGAKFIDYIGCSSSPTYNINARFLAAGDYVCGWEVWCVGTGTAQHRNDLVVTGSAQNYGGVSV